MNSVRALRRAVSNLAYRAMSIARVRIGWRRYRPGVDPSEVPPDRVFIVHDPDSRFDLVQAAALAGGLARSHLDLACGPIYEQGHPRRVVAAGYELGHDGSAPVRIPLLAGEALRRGWAGAVTSACRPSGNTFAVRADQLVSALGVTDGSESAVSTELRRRGPWAVVWSAALAGEDRETDDLPLEAMARREDGRGEVHEFRAPSAAAPGTPLLPPAAIWVGDRPSKRSPGLDVHRLDPTVAIRHAATDWSVAERWGDHHFASAVADAFANRGIGARVVPRHAWSHPFAARELVITLRGLEPAHPVLDRTNLLWIISHPSDLRPEEFEGYDLVAVASLADIDRVASLTSKPVFPLMQATDSRLYREPGRGDGTVVFIGNSRGARRRSVEWATEQDIRLRVYGQGWDWFAGEEVEVFDPVGRVEASDRFNTASVVLGDHWDDMRELGYVSNRVFDVAASGGLLVTDRVSGIDDLLPGVPTYTSSAELGELVRRWLAADREERATHIQGLQTLVLSRHTFDQRVQSLLEALRERVPYASDLVSRLFDA